MEVPLLGILGNNSTLLQEEVGDLSSIRGPSTTELDLKVFALMTDVCWLTLVRECVLVCILVCTSEYTLGSHSRNDWSCCCGPSWRYQMPPAGGWTEG